ncbi:MAG: hypothetical protein PHH00_01250 [Candidatus Nanoarchaeia archaeon]|nr:hypothetical protein [Candidatus Nanoarchaeia archaeon]
MSDAETTDSRDETEQLRLAYKERLGLGDGAYANLTAFELTGFEIEEATLSLMLGALRDPRIVARAGKNAGRANKDLTTGQRAKLGEYAMDACELAYSYREDYEGNPGGLAEKILEVLDFRAREE